MTSFDKSILATIVYYDVLGLPLTAFEIYKYLINFKKPISLSDTSDALENNEVLEKFINHKNGFYFLKDRDNIVAQRIRKEKIIQEKWKKCKFFIKLLGMVSFLRLVVLSGSMAVGNASKDSDIDLLVVAKRGRIWTTRLLVTILLSILGKRRHGRFIKDRICLNHYITDESLKIDFPSLYNAQTYAHLIPVLGDTSLFGSFQRENSWVKKWVLLNSGSRQEDLKYLKPSSILKTIASLGEIILKGKRGNFAEKILAGCQKKVIGRKTDAKHNAKQTQRDEGLASVSRRTHEVGVSRQFSGRGRITIDDTQLEFHPDSPEAWIIDKYNQKMKELGFPELAGEKDSGLIAS